MRQKLGEKEFDFYFIILTSSFEMYHLGNMSGSNFQSPDVLH